MHSAQGRLAQEPDKREWHWQAIRTHHSNYRLSRRSPLLITVRKDNPLSPLRLSVFPLTAVVAMSISARAPPTSKSASLSLVCCDLAWASGPAQGRCSCSVRLTIVP